MVRRMLSCTIDATASCSQSEMHAGFPEPLMNTFSLPCSAKFSVVFGPAWCGEDDGDQGDGPHIG